MLARDDGSQWEARAAAKLNLFLEVLRRRDDGYHEVQTVMVPVSVYDTLLLRPISAGRVRLTVRNALGNSPARLPSTPLPEGDDNLVLRALQLLRERAGVAPGAEVLLVKRIPLQAGLGGGSSDAAAALLLGNRAWQLDWGIESLVELAAELGSDIPFFLYEGSCLCAGRGEQVQQVRQHGRLHFVVVCPAEGLSTGEVYAGCRIAGRPHSAGPVLETLRRGDATGVGAALYNRLQQPAFELSPAIEQLRQIFSRLDLLGHQLTGSGSAYFGICRSARHAARMAGRLRSCNLGRVYVLTSCR